MPLDCLFIYALLKLREKHLIFLLCETSYNKHLV